MRDQPPSKKELHIELRPLNGGTPEMEGAIRVFMNTWKRSRGEVVPFFRQHQSYPDYCGLVAVVNGDVAGMAFGTRSEPGQWWHDKVAAHVGYDHPALQDAWVLTEFAVAAPYRDHGVGSLIHDALLEMQPCPRVLLSTGVDNSRARAFYEHRGWQYLHPGFVFYPGDRPFVIMHKELAPYTRKKGIDAASGRWGGGKRHG